MVRDITRQAAATISIRAKLSLGLVLAVVAGTVTGCAGPLVGTPRMGAGLGFACKIERPNSSETFFTGNDGRPMFMTPAECAAANEQAQRRQAEQQLAAQRQQEERQRADLAASEALLREKMLGYEQTTVKDLLLDAKVLESKNAKLAVTGFYKPLGRHNERFYVSYNDYMMHTYQSIEATNVGLLTADGSRRLREYLQRCVAGCELTILGHITSCVETNPFGASTTDFCLTADDMRAP